MLEVIITPSTESPHLRRMANWAAHLSALSAVGAIPQCLVKIRLDQPKGCRRTPPFQSGIRLQGVMFYDDELNVSKGMVDLMRKIKATGIDWRLRGFVKSELFNDEQAEALYDAGFRWLLCGFEAAHPRILRNINKKATVEDNSRMLETAHTPRPKG